MAQDSERETAREVLLQEARPPRVRFNIEGLPQNICAFGDLGPIELEASRFTLEANWCSGGDLNPHAFRHTPLKRTCLPFHHPSVEKKETFRRRQPVASTEYLSSHWNS